MGDHAPGGDQGGGAGRDCEAAARGRCRQVTGEHVGATWWHVQGFLLHDRPLCKTPFLQLCAFGEVHWHATLILGTAG